MGFDIQLPQINAQTSEGKLEQIRSYLYQFTEQLKWALNTFEETSNSGGIVVTTSNGTGAAVIKKVSTFNELKDLIVSSADLVESIATEVKQLYDGSGTYVAVSDFGTYKEERSALLEVDTETGVTLLMEKEATIDKDNDGNPDKTREYKGCIKIGNVTMSHDEDDVYGISVGQISLKDDDTKGEYTANARFTSTTLDFFDGSGNRVAYIDKKEKGGKFYIENAEILTSLIIGNYYIDASGGGLAFTWTGGN